MAPISTDKSNLFLRVPKTMLRNIWCLEFGWFYEKPFCDNVDLFQWPQFLPM